MPRPAHPDSFTKAFGRDLRAAGLRPSGCTASATATAPGAGGRRGRQDCLGRVGHASFAFPRTANTHAVPFLATQAAGRVERPIFGGGGGRVVSRSPGLRTQLYSRRASPAMSRPRPRGPRRTPSGWCAALSTPRRTAPSGASGASDCDRRPAPPWRTGVPARPVPGLRAGAGGHHRGAVFDDPRRRGPGGAGTSTSAATIAPTTPGATRTWRGLWAWSASTRSSTELSRTGSDARGGPKAAEWPDQDRCGSGRT